MVQNKFIAVIFQEYAHLHLFNNHILTTTRDRQLNGETVCLCIPIINLAKKCLLSCLGNEQQITIIIIIIIIIIISPLTLCRFTTQ